MRDSFTRQTRIPTRVLAGLVVVFLALGAADPHASPAKEVLIKGTAYTFDNQEPIAGATIRARGTRRLCDQRRAATGCGSPSVRR